MTNNGSTKPVSLGHFRFAAKTFQNEANFKWFSFLSQITQERFCTSPCFESEGFWNSEMAFFKNTIILFVFAPKFSILSIVSNLSSSKEKSAPLSIPNGTEVCLFYSLVWFAFVFQTQRFIRVYNLTKQELTKKLVSNVKWISSMAVHPKGNKGSWKIRRTCRTL